MTINGSQFQGAVGALLPTSASGDKEAASNVLLRRCVVWEGHDNAALATNIAESLVFLNDTGITLRVVKVKMAAPIAVSAHADNYAQVVVQKYYSNGTAVGNISTQTERPTANGGTGSLVAHTPAEVANYAYANDQIANAQFVTCKVLKFGSGIALTNSVNPQDARFKVLVYLEPA